MKSVDVLREQDLLGRGNSTDSTSIAEVTQRGMRTVETYDRLDRAQIRHALWYEDRARVTSTQIEGLKSALGNRLLPRNTFLYRIQDFCLSEVRVRVLQASQFALDASTTQEAELLLEECLRYRGALEAPNLDLGIAIRDAAMLQGQGDATMLQDQDNAIVSAALKCLEDREIEARREALELVRLRLRSPLGVQMPMHQIVAYDNSVVILGSGNTVSAQSSAGVSELLPLLSQLVELADRNGAILVREAGKAAYEEISGAQSITDRARNLLAGLGFTVQSLGAASAAYSAIHSVLAIAGITIPTWTP
jgi:hypothetical protein